MIRWRELLHNTGHILMVLATTSAPPASRWFTPAESAPQPQPQRTTNVNTLAWIAKLLQFAPIIAQGIATLHADKDLGTKQQMANDALELATEGAKVGLPVEDAQQVDVISGIVKNGMNGTIAALHNGQQPAAA